MQSFLVGCIGICGLFLLAGQPGESSKERGAEVYKQYCQLCHQADGNGVAMVNPPLVKIADVTGNKRPLITWVLKGSGLQKKPVDGKTYANNMIAMSMLSDQQIADVLTYIRSSFGNKASAVTVSEVKAAREATK